MTRPLSVDGPLDSDPSNIDIGTSDKDMSNNVEIFGGEDPVFGAVESGTASAELELTFNNVIISEGVSVNSETVGDEEVASIEDNFNDNGLVSTGNDGDGDGDMTTADLTVLNESVTVVLAVVVVAVVVVVTVIAAAFWGTAPCTMTELFGLCTERVLAIGCVNT